MIAWMDGAFVDEAEATISIFDRGFLYGDTIYETLRSAEGRIVFWPEHARRLRRSLELAQYDIRGDEHDLEAVGRELLRRNGLSEARLRITISRGTGDPDQVDDFSAVWVMTSRPLVVRSEEEYEAGVPAILATVRRNGVSSLNPEIKSGNYLNNLFARREARLRGAVEGVMLNPDGWLAEGASSNLFWVVDGAIETPSLEVGILHGVTREKILGLATSGAREVFARPDRLSSASEVFVASTTWEVLPVTRWEGRVVGDGRRGPVAKRLREALRALYTRG